MLQWLWKRFDRVFIVLQVWVDGLIVAGSFFLGFWLFRGLVVNTEVPLTVSGESVPIRGPDLQDYVELMAIIMFSTMAGFWYCGMYGKNKSILNVEEYRSAFKAIVLAFFLSSSAIFFLKSPAMDWEMSQLREHNFFYRLISPIHEILQVSATDIDKYSRVMFLIIFVLIFFFMVIQRALMFWISSRLHAHGFGNTNVAVFGTGPMALRVQQKLRLFPRLGYNFVGFLDDQDSLHGHLVRGHPVLGGRDQLDEIRQRHDIKHLIIAKPQLDEDKLVELCSRCENYGISYQVVPRLYHFFSKRYTVENLDSIPLITLSDKNSQPVYRPLKYLMDFIAASAALAIAGIPMLAIALLIKRGSQGPIFFSQLRVGQGGKTFRILKFRTMFVEMCGDEITPQTSSDPRITKIGRFLRATSLDELPQFFNVLKGEMSLVGPRPEMPFIVETYSSVDRLRLDAKPGITGLWQVSEARKAPIHENLDYDLYYIENQSIFLDVVILVMSLLSVFRLRATA